jgi:cytochrome c556
MFTIKKLLIASSILAFTTVINFSIAKESDLSKPNAAKGSLKLVMQGLLADTQALTAAMLMEDFTSIEKIAKEIADHPKPILETRMKLMKAMGAEMAKFKIHDGVVHGAAVDMVKNAQNKDIIAIGENFQNMIGGCVSCHSEFKARVSAIFM